MIDTRGILHFYAIGDKELRFIRSANNVSVQKDFFDMREDSTNISVRVVDLLLIQSEKLLVVRNAAKLYFWDLKTGELLRSSDNNSKVLHMDIMKR
jgi:hypothetical protein